MRKIYDALTYCEHATTSVLGSGDLLTVCVGGAPVQEGAALKFKETSLAAQLDRVKALQDSHLEAVEAMTEVGDVCTPRMWTAP